MKKQKNIKLLEGGVIGAVLGIAAGMFLMSKPGKKLQKDIKQQSAAFYKHVSPQLKKIQKMGEKEYKSFIKDALKKYSKARKLSLKEEKDLLREVQKSWKQFQKHLK